MERFVLLASLALALGALFTATAQEKGFPLPPGRPDAPAYSEEAMERFVNVHLTPILDRLLSGTYPLFAIRWRWNVIETTASVRYGRRIEVHPATGVGLSNPYIFGTVRLEDSIPCIYLAVPGLMGAYAVLTRQMTPLEAEMRFEVLLITLILHEGDHLLLEHWKKATTFDEFVEVEREAWAETCLYTLDAFVRAGYSRYTKGTLAKIHGAWVTVGGNRDDPRFRAAIAEIHRPLALSFGNGTARR